MQITKGKIVNNGCGVVLKKKRNLQKQIDLIGHTTMKPWGALLDRYDHHIKVEKLSELIFDSTESPRFDKKGRVKYWTNLAKSNIGN